MASVARQIQNDVNRSLKLRGYAARIKQGRGEVYFYGATCDGWYTTSIGTCFLENMTAARYVEEFEFMKAQHDATRD